MYLGQRQVPAEAMFAKLEKNWEMHCSCCLLCYFRLLVCTIYLEREALKIRFPGESLPLCCYHGHFHNHQVESWESNDPTNKSDFLFHDCFLLYWLCCYL